MKKLLVLIVALVTSIISSHGYAASTESEEAADSSTAMNEAEAPGMMRGMHHEGMMHHGMMRHHTMHSGPSPVTVLVYPGTMPMMGYGMMHHGSESHHKGKKMHQMHREKKKDHQTRREEHMRHMEDMEQRLANIEKLLGQLLEEMQKKD